MCSRVKIFVLVKMRKDETKVDSLVFGEEGGGGEMSSPNVMLALTNF